MVFHCIKVKLKQHNKHFKNCFFLPSSLTSKTNKRLRWQRGTTLPVYDSNNPQFDRNDSAHQDVHGICTGIHQIQLGHHRQGSSA